MNKEQMQLEIQMRQARKEDIQKRIQDHKSKVDQFRSGIQRRSLRAAVELPLDFLALGDSWFYYPLNDDDLFVGNEAIPAQLETMGNPPPRILNLAQAGQTSTEMMTYENQRTILDSLTNPSTTSWNNGKTADGILVSAGGDDIVGDQFAIYLDYHGSGLAEARFNGILASVEASYLTLFALRDVAAQELEIDPKAIPIFGHCYDYAIPNGEGVTLAGLPYSGPWLQEPLNFCGYNYNEGLKIVADAIDGFYSMLQDLASDKVTLPGKSTNNFHLVNTRGTITRDQVRPNGWANEIHPFTEGFIALAKRFLAELQADFPGRI